MSNYTIISKQVPTWIASNVSGVKINSVQLLWQLLAMILAPIVVGKALQVAIPPLARFMNGKRAKMGFKLFQSIVLLVMPLTSVSKSASDIRNLAGTQIGLLIGCGLGQVIAIQIYGFIVTAIVPMEREIKKALIVTVSYKFDSTDCSSRRTRRWQ